MTSADSLSLLRRGLLALLAFGSAGILVELVLLEHYEEPFQWTPLVLLSLTLASILWHWLDGRKRSLRAFQVVMLLLIVAGTVGVALHSWGNFEFERELNPDSAGLEFWIEVLRGATPMLAPGTLVQFGLLGLLYAYRHPALTPPPGP
ncbi:MAG: hypothetical protein WD771_05915 [Gemmatimonadaceae bacterium]